MAKYINRYNDVFTFTKQEDGNVLWEGNFEYHRMGFAQNTDTINMVDPSGGPYIEIGQMLSHVVFDDEFNVIVESFEPIETGYLIKTKPHKS